ncbi:cell envelope integrity protein TolA [Rickettsiales bacterium]|nr:cell envelope integrity protein TolA [Rickettsiales bacterium]
MFNSFIRSILFHLVVISALLILPNYINFSKKTIISEIPIEVVDISEKTKIKKSQKKKTINKETNESFTAPKVVSKPKVPEFVEKVKENKPKKKKVEEEVKENKKQKETRLSSILKSIDKLKEEKKKNDQEKPILEPVENDTLDQSEKLTISELDMIRRQFINCWNVPAGAKNIQNLQVLVKIKLDEDGNVIDSELIKTNSLNDSFYKAAAESAMRAVRHPSCKKLKVPVKKYKTWKNITLNFDPSMLAK